MAVRNVWGIKVQETRGDPWYTEEKDRVDKDDPSAPDANALTDGDDLDGWTPEDGEPE